MSRRGSLLALATVVVVPVTAATAVAIPASAAGFSTLAGVVTDTHGKPVAGASVTLLSNGSPNGNYTAVPAGSATMSTANQRNPDTTTKTGHYGWAVADGFYKVTVQKKDCYAPNSYSSATNTVTTVVTSGAQQVPPANSHLDLSLDCTNIAPVAAIQAPSIVRAGVPVTLSGQPSSDANGSVTSYRWTFGDGTSATTSTPTIQHTYAVYGAFTPTLSVKDDQGATSRTTTGSPIAVGNVPAIVTNLTATSGVKSVSLSWSAPPANGSAITGYHVAVTPNQGNASTDTTNTSVTINGLTGGKTYAFAVTAHNALGDSSPATTSAVAQSNGSDPSVTITQATSGYTAATNGSLTFAASPVGTPTTCALDAAAAAACTSPYTTPGTLAEGSHTVVVDAKDASNGEGTSSKQWVVDRTPPTAALLQPRATTSLTRSIAVQWGAADPNGVASYDVRYTKAAWNGKASAPVAWQSAVTSTAASLTGTLGTEYCFSTRARDTAGNTSAWTAPQCVAIPLDDRSLSASSGWTRAKSSGAFNGTLTTTKTKGRTLTRKGAIAGRAALVVTKGRGFGSVDVLYNGKVVKTVSLSATRTTNEVVVALPKVTKKNTTIVIRTRSAKPVKVDGLLLARV